MNYFKDVAIRKILFIITFTVLLTAMVFNYNAVFNMIGHFLSILYPFILGGIIAFILNVLLRLYELTIFKKVSFETKKGKSFKRPICLTLTILTMMAILFVIAFLLIPRFVEAVMAFVKQLSLFIPEAQKYLQTLVDENKNIRDLLMSLNIDYEQILRNLTNLITTNLSKIFSNAGNIFSSAIGLASTIAGTLFTFMIAFIFAMYLLIQKEKLSHQLRMVMNAMFSDKICASIEHILLLSFETFSSFVSGQGVEAVVIGSLVGGCCWLFGLSYASVVGVIVAICSFIPMFGSMIALVIGTLIQLLVSPYQAVFFLIMMTIIQQIDGNLIYPNIMGNRIGLPAMYVLIAFSVGGSLFGLFGMLLFIPITSILYDLFTEWTLKRLEKKGKLKKSVQE